MKIFFSYDPYQNDHLGRCIPAAGMEDHEQPLFSIESLTPKELDQAYTSLEEKILNRNNEYPLHLRFRAIFTLKAFGSDRAVEILGKCFDDPSGLFKHEVGYVMGQMRNTAAISILAGVLADLDQDPMVRHEAGESLGAI